MRKIREKLLRADFLASCGKLYEISQRTISSLGKSSVTAADVEILGWNCDLTGSEYFHLCWKFHTIMTTTTIAFFPKEAEQLKASVNGFYIFVDSLLFIGRLSCVCMCAWGGGGRGGAYLPKSHSLRIPVSVLRSRFWGLMSLWQMSCMWM